MADTRKPLAADLRPASFRGVPFHVDGSGLAAGRRTQVHEYPKRDKPYVEDMGRATREISLTAMLVGDDYVAQAKRLLTAIEAAGPGTLVHPWLGTMTVSLKDVGRVEFTASLGLATVALTFVESGELAFPAASTSTQAASRIAASALEKSAVAAFVAKFNVKGYQDFVSKAASGGLGDSLGIVASSDVGKLLGLSDSLASTTLAAVALMSNPETLGWKLIGAIGLSGVATSYAAWSSVVRSICAMTSSGSLSGGSSASGATPSRQQAVANAQAVNALIRQGLLAQAVGASSLVGGPTDTSGPSYTELVSIRSALSSAIDDEALTASDDVYDALQAARRAAWADLTARSRDNARMTTITPPVVVPAVVLAYDAYENAERADEIVVRNKVRHPGFVPALPIRLLTR